MTGIDPSDGPHFPISRWLYRLALRRYPSRLRRRFGRQMEEDFLRLMGEDVEAHGALGRLRTWYRAGRDLARPLPDSLQRGRGTKPGSPRPPPDGQEEGRVSGTGRLAVMFWIGQEAKHSLRALTRAPRFASLVVVILGLGIAISAVAFGLVDAYLLEPLPYPEAERLVQVRPANAGVGWRNTSEVFERAVSWDLDGLTLVGDPRPEVVLGAWVSPDFFDTFGADPVLGRAFSREEAGEGGIPVAVISHDLWKDRFGRSPDILDTVIRAYSSDRPGELETFQVVGVLPADFWHLNGYTQILLPLRDERPVYVGRLRPNVSPRRARQILTAMAEMESNPELGPGGRVSVRPLQAAYTENIRGRLFSFQIAAVLVLLVAALNATLLILVRGTGRVEEMSIRRALGAGRHRVGLQLFLEGAILAFSGGVLGLVLGSLGLQAVGGVLEERVGAPVPGGAAGSLLDGSAVVMALGLCALLAVGFGAFPLWATLRPKFRGFSGTRYGSTEPRSTQRARRLLVAGEVALSLTLLIGGTLMVRSALSLERADLGFTPERLQVFTVGLPEGRALTETDRVSFFRNLSRRVGSLPQVQAGGLVRGAPFSNNLTPREVEAQGVSGRTTLPRVLPQIADDGYPTVLGLQLSRGRWMDPGGGGAGSSVAVVSRSLAQRAWPGENPVGKQLRFPEWNMRDLSEEPGPWLQVVGVVSDVANGIQPEREVVYVSHGQAPSPWMDLVVRARPGMVVQPDDVRDILHDMDPEIPLFAHVSLQEAVSRARTPSRFFSGLLGGFSVFSLFLALLGLYGVAAYAARRRSRDVAIRIALGARTGLVQRLFVKEVLWTLLLGLAAGVWGGRILGGALQSQLHNVDSGDPMTILAMTAVVGIMALLAAWLPARRAANLDPMRILREE